MKSVATKGRVVVRPRGLALIAWALFGNADDPLPPADYMPGKAQWRRRIAWWVRNPFHNGCFYGWGCCDRDSVSVGDDPEKVFCDGLGWLRAKTYPQGSKWGRPFVSHRGRRWRWYAGWRTPGGAFGFKFQRNRPD